MAHTSHEQRADSSKEDRQATQQAMDRRRPPPLAANPFVSPFGLLSAFLGDMDRIVRGFGLPAPFPFRSGFGSVSPKQAGASGSASAPPTWAPPLEVLTRDGEFVVRAEIPGIDKEHVHVEIDEGRAVISGEREEEHEDKGEGFFRSERSYGRFSRVVALPEGANAEQAGVDAIFAGRACRRSCLGSEHSRGPSERSKETATSEPYRCFRCLFHGVLPVVESS